MSCEQHKAHVLFTTQMQIVQDEILSWSCLSLLHESVFVQTVSQTQTPAYCRHCTDANSLMCCINLRTLAYISESSNLFKCLHFPPNKAKHTKVHINIPAFQCSHTCDHGLQKRTVSCHRVNLYSWVDPETTDVTRCSHSQRPQEVRACVLPGCGAQANWVPGEWSKVQNSLQVFISMKNSNSSVYRASNVGQEGSRKDLFFAKTLRERGSARRGADWNMAANLNRREKEGVKKQCVDLKAVRM